MSNGRGSTKQEMKKSVTSIMSELKDIEKTFLKVAIPAFYFLRFKKGSFVMNRYPLLLFAFLSEQLYQLKSDRHSPKRTMRIHTLPGYPARPWLPHRGNR